jgi:hypothetical protein
MKGKRLHQQEAPSTAQAVNLHPNMITAGNASRDEVLRADHVIANGHVLTFSKVTLASNL